MRNAESPTTKKLLDQSISEGLLPGIDLLAPPKGSNADWDELVSGENVELRLIREHAEELGHIACRRDIVW